MSGKGKQAEVASARIRLDATLQNLVDRKEDSQDASEGESSVPPIEICKPTPSPKKSAQKPNRKRKRRSDSGEHDNADGHQTVIMKLFDRSVDLALFPEETPLYPVCRAWIQNRPHDKSLGTLDEKPASPKQEEEPPQPTEMFPNVYEMPPPIKSEDGCIYDLRVPEPVPQPIDKLDINYDPKQAPPAEQLLLNHMARWKEVRNRWREASVMNEMQYAGSIHLLKDMFDRNVVDSA